MEEGRSWNPTENLVLDLEELRYTTCILKLDMLHILCGYIMVILSLEEWILFGQREGIRFID